MLKNLSLISLLLSLSVAGMAFTAGKEGYLAMTAKAEAQEQAVTAFQSWRSEYKKLLPVEERWKKDLPSALVAKDLFSVYKQVGDAPKTNPDKMLVEKVERLKQGDKDLGANRVCLMSASTSGVLFEGESFAELFKGLKVLAERPDIQMRDVSLSLKDGKPRAVVGEFCLLMRDPTKQELAA